MKRYKMHVAYDGTDFNGWQFQPEVPSVIGAMQETFAQLFDRKIHMIGASRTDAGVHALGQVAAFSSDIDLLPDRLRVVWNDRLPSTIVIRSLEQVDDRFHPMYGVEKKIYGYHFFSERPLPFTYRYGWHIRKKIDIKMLKKALQIFEGTHDFALFCTEPDAKNSTVRHIESIKLEHFGRYGLWRIRFVGPGFLRHMIRRIVGACFDVATKGKVSIEDIDGMLAGTARAKAPYNAPGHGLCLYKVKYK